ncbi:TIR domain-containing protein [Sulfurovum sp. ST-21]|uniref:TIR domain-containing protein n=1 Tax=Sulfurovum indicum TaxID=2779528 RepID=A0A7M1S4F1_9BACT|nr:toll/interleukin-1 receptor domain-containing protein [Sulfurovum indicum]QOR61230.1 TIR domain-containing protein [Sulfurovum indicum]
MAVVFISHSSKDKDKVNEIVEAIRLQGFDSIFLDHDKLKGIKTGEHWEQRLYREIKRTHAMLLILSPAWIDSKWCFAEYTQAKALGKEIIPVVIDHGIDNEVDQWIDGFLQKSDISKDQHDLSRVISRLKEISVHTQRGFEWDRHRSPYPGMMSFEEEDAAIFFGREDDTLEVIEKLNAMRNRNAPKFLNIVAASGMGKSSFLKAGIIPQLKRSYSDRWIVLPVQRPTRRPLYAFAKNLAAFLNKEQEYKSIYEALWQENYQEVLDDLVSEIEFVSPQSAILFPVDQAEELYSLAEKDEKEQFFRSLYYLLKEKEHFFAIWTLRADFLKEFQADKALKPICKTMELFALTPLRKENVSSIIKDPAVVAGIDIDERLIEKIKEDMQTTDALPLLALGMSELYQKYGKSGQITLEGYKALARGEENPLEHIIQQKAEEAIKGFREDAETMRALKEAFIPHLVRVNSKNEYIKRIALWEELPAKAYAVLEELVKARLLIKKSEEGKEVIEISHEALIRKWPLLQNWLQEEQEFLVGKSQLEIALQEYSREDANTRHRAYLSGIRLQKASSWLLDYQNQLSTEEKNYIKKSIAFHEKQEKRRKTLYLGVFLVVLLFGLFSAWQWRVAKVNEERATVQAKLAEKSEKTALDRLATIEKQKNDMIGAYWVLFLNDDAKDGHIDKLDKVSKILTYLDANVTRKDFLINVLTKYFSKKGLGLKFEEKELNDFDKIFTGIVFRKSKYVGMELEARLSLDLWLLSKEQLKALDRLISTLLSQNLPDIFQRYRNVNDKDRQTLEYLSFMLKYMYEPNEELLNKLMKFKQFKSKTENSVYSGLDTLLNFTSVFNYVNSERFAKEYTQDRWEQILNEGIEKIVKISRVLYRHSSQYPELYTTKEKETIEDMYFYGIYKMKIDYKKINRKHEVPDWLRGSLYINKFMIYKYKEKIEKLFKDYKLKEIEEQINHILAIQDDNFWALNQLSYSYLLQENKEAIVLVDKMIKLFPTQKEYLNKKLKACISILKDTNLNLNKKEEKTLFNYYFNMASCNAANGNLSKAIRITRDSLKKYDDMPNKLRAERFGNLSWFQLLSGEYKEALKSAEEGLKLDPAQKWIETNLAHAKLFLGKYDEAKMIYVKNKGLKLDSGQIWDDVIIEDFAIFGEKGIKSKYFKEIEVLLKKDKT